jgi:hypothetical protein
VGIGAFRPRLKVQGFAACALGSLALLELGSYGYSLLHVAPAEDFLGPDPVASAIRRSRTTPNQAPARLKCRDSFYTDLRAISNGFEKTNINDSFQLKHAAILYERLYGIASVSRPRLPEAPLDRVVDDHQRAIRQRVFDLLSVENLVSDRVESDPSWPVLETGPWRDRASFVVQRNPTALPRAYVVGHAKVLEADPSRIPSSLLALDPRRSVGMFEDPLAGLSEKSEDRQTFKPASWLSADPDHPVIEVTTEKPGLLVIADTWMPGWIATIDGEPTEVLRGNAAQRVIPIRKPGTHQVRLDYHPPGMVLGIATCLGTLMIWAAVCVRIRRSNDALKPNRGVS